MLNEEETMDQNEKNDCAIFRTKLEELARELSAEPDVILHLGEPPEDQEQTENQIDFALKDMATGRYRLIVEALQRIDKGVYGVCDDCGQQIDRERLEIIPEATCCVKCQRTRERQAASQFGVTDKDFDFI
jgi:RNA polymerase-binding transcription factor DksA